MRESANGDQKFQIFAEIQCIPVCGHLRARETSVLLQFVSTRDGIPYIDAMDDRLMGAYENLPELRPKRGGSTELNGDFCVNQDGSLPAEWRWKLTAPCPTAPQKAVKHNLSQQDRIKHNLSGDTGHLASGSRKLRAQTTRTAYHMGNQP